MCRQAAVFLALLAFALAPASAKRSQKDRQDQAVQLDSYSFQKRRSASADNNHTQHTNKGIHGKCPDIVPVSVLADQGNGYYAKQGCNTKWYFKCSDSGDQTLAANMAVAVFFETINGTETVKGYKGIESDDGMFAKFLKDHCPEKDDPDDSYEMSLYLCGMCEHALAVRYDEYEKRYESGDLAILKSQNGQTEFNANGYKLEWDHDMENFKLYGLPGGNETSEWFQSQTLPWLRGTGGEFYAKSSTGKVERTTDDDPNRLMVDTPWANSMESDFTATESNGRMNEKYDSMSCLRNRCSGNKCYDCGHLDCNCYMH